MGMLGESIMLSRISAGSGVKSAFGRVSAGGAGTPAFEVTQKGKPPLFTP